MALEHLQFLTVFKTDNVIRKNRTLDRYRWLRTLRLRISLTGTLKCIVYVLDHTREFISGHGIIGNVRGNNLGSQLEERDVGFRL